MIVLLVDDNEADRALYGAVLESEGLRVVEAESASAAMETCGRMTPDMVLVDGFLAGVDGFELCRQLRQRPDLRTTPILILSGIEDASASERAERAGANGFVLKSPDWNALVRAIRSVAPGMMSRPA